MKISKNTFILAIASVVICAWGIYNVFLSDSDVELAKHEEKTRKIRMEKKEKNKVRRARTRIRKDKIAVKREKPQLLALDDDEDAKLNEYSRKILADLQKALDSENFSLVKKLVAKMLEIPPDPKFGAEGVATLLRRNAVEALGWFGAKGLPELAALLADPDPDVAQASIDQFNLALEDITLSDYERADIISMAAKVLKDPDGLEMMFMEINDMRHSVGAGLLVDICLNGTDVAKGLCLSK